MSFESAKYQATGKIILEEPETSPCGKSRRQRCISRIESELGMSFHGASTYFSNMAKHLKIGSPRGASSAAVVRTIEKVVSAGDLACELDPNLLPVRTRNTEVYSMVTVDSAKVAIDVRCFNDKQTCLDKCNATNKCFIKGHQKKGARLGVLRTTANTTELTADDFMSLNT